MTSALQIIGGSEISSNFNVSTNGLNNNTPAFDQSTNFNNEFICTNIFSMCVCARHCALATQCSDLSWTAVYHCFLSISGLIQMTLHSFRTDLSQMNAPWFLFHHLCQICCVQITFATLLHPWCWDNFLLSKNRNVSTWNVYLQENELARFMHFFYQFDANVEFWNFTAHSISFVHLHRTKYGPLVPSSRNPWQTSQEYDCWLIMLATPKATWNE